MVSRSSRRSLPRFTVLERPARWRTVRRRGQARGTAAQLVALLTALTMGAAACGNGDSSAADPAETEMGPDAEAGTDGGGTEAGAEDRQKDDSEQPQELVWEDCGGDLECAELEVPVNYDNPSAGTLTLGVERVPAQGEREGALFVNPGGPGGEITGIVDFVAGALAGELTERFDVVAVEPRGTGASEIDCGADFAELYGVDPTLDSPEDREDLLDISEDYIDGCEEAVGDLLPHLGTRNVAHDMDSVRQAMGDEQLNYLGYSYGTSIGQVYLDLYPERVRAMILDGVVEHGPSGVEAAQQQANGFEQALGALADDCDGQQSCELAPDTVEQIDQLTEVVEREPVAASPRDLGPGELALATAMALYDETYWRSLTDGVAEALEGDGSTLVGLADEYIGFGGFDVYFAVSCLDSEWPDEPDQLLATAEEANQTAPHFGEAIVNDYVRCAMWPEESQPLEPTTAPGASPVLVVSTTNDPATPYQNGVNVAEQLESGVLLTHQGDGHTVVGNGVPCIDDAAIVYLVDLQPPADGTVCES